MIYMLLTLVRNMLNLAKFEAGVVVNIYYGNKRCCLWNGRNDLLSHHRRVWLIYTKCRVNSLKTETPVRWTPL